MEKTYPDLLPHVSSCKSPQQMFGAIAKTYYADKMGIPRDKMFVVSIMPCIAKKYECQRPEMNASGYQDVDCVLTTRELAKMIRIAGLSFDALPEEEFDHPLGLGFRCRAPSSAPPAALWKLPSAPSTRSSPARSRRAWTSPPAAARKASRKQPSIWMAHRSRLRLPMA